MDNDFLEEWYPEIKWEEALDLEEYWIEYEESLQEELDTCKIQKK